MKLPPMPDPRGLSRVLARIGAIKARFRTPVAPLAPAATFARALSQAGRAQPSSLREIVTSAAVRHQLDPDLLLALAETESGLRPDAVSPRGALGIMQLMPDTAQRLGVVDPFDVGANIDAGARTLKEHLDRFDGNLALALAAYNAGPAAVLKYGGIPPFQETRSFVSRVLARQATLAR